MPKGLLYSTASGLLSDKLINHNSVEIHTQNHCLELDLALSHQSAMERADINFSKERSEIRELFFNQSESIQSSKSPITSDVQYD